MTTLQVRPVEMLPWGRNFTVGNLCHLGCSFVLWVYSPIISWGSVSSPHTYETV